MSANYYKFEKPSNGMITNKLALYLYIFGMCIEGKIGSNVNDNLIVVKEES